jgi:hypothetical protein
VNVWVFSAPYGSKAGSTGTGICFLKQEAGTLSSFENVPKTRYSSESYRIWISQMRPPGVRVSILLNVTASVAETENDILRVLVRLNRVTGAFDGETASCRSKP